MKVEFFFDFSCPYAYIGSTQIARLCEAHGATLIPKPFLLGGVFRHWARPQNMASTMNPAKARHNALDMHRWAAFYDVPLQIPTEHPLRTVEALRLLLVAPKASWWPLIEAIYRAYWVEGRDVRDRAVLAEIATAAGLDGAALASRVDEPEVKAELRSRTEEAIERGVFGAPTTCVEGVEGPGFWGQDRLPMIEAAVAAPGAPRLFPDLPEVTPEPGHRVRFYYDFSSPFAYLASTQIEALCARAQADLVWHPMLLGAVFKQIGTPVVPMQAQVAPKQQHSAVDMRRHAELYDVPFAFPSRFPMRTVAPLRLVLAAEEETPESVPKLIQRIFRAYWAEDRDISDTEVLASLCEDAGLDGQALVEATRRPEIKQRLFQTTSDAVEAGVFGAPTFQIDDSDALVWGQDRLGILLWSLRT